MSFQTSEHIHHRNGASAGRRVRTRQRLAAHSRDTKTLSPSRNWKTNKKVAVWVEDVLIPTWLPAAPDKNPMFLEKRVYQGSSGKVYPLPFTDRIAEKPIERRWKAVW